MPLGSECLEELTSVKAAGSRVKLQPPSRMRQRSLGHCLGQGCLDSNQRRLSSYSSESAEVASAAGTIVAYSGTDGAVGDLDFDLDLGLDLAGRPILHRCEEDSPSQAEAT